MARIVAHGQNCRELLFHHDRINIVFDDLYADFLVFPKEASFYKLAQQVDVHTTNLQAPASLSQRVPKGCCWQLGVKRSMLPGLFFEQTELRQDDGDLRLLASGELVCRISCFYGQQHIVWSTCRQNLGLIEEAHMLFI